MDSTQQPNSTERKSMRSWAPRMWVGSDFFAWLRIMSRGRFRFNLPHVYIGVCTSFISFGHSVLRCVQNVAYRRQINQTRIDKAPIFIIGHWRTGTTLLHEMLILDGQHNFPNTYQCYDPTHFLLTEKYFKKWFGFLLPERRPMDNMNLGWDRPQEDEFALCMLGQPSPYLDIVFPNRPPLTPGALDLEGISPRERRNWKRTFYRYLQTLTFKDPRRLVLKSPPHSCRIPILLEMFPDARFIHIVRNPYDVFPSTVKLWKSLAEKHGVQTPHHRNIKERVLQTLPHLYAKLEEGKKRVRPDRFHELRYEDLVRDPLGEVRQIYDRLELGGFEELRPRLAEYLHRNANYETNKFRLAPAQRDEITQRWGDVIRHYGYPIEGSAELLDASVSRPNLDVPTILPFPAVAAEGETALAVEPEPSKAMRRAS